MTFTVRELISAARNFDYVLIGHSVYYGDNIETVERYAGPCDLNLIPKEVLGACVKCFWSEDDDSLLCIEV